MEERRQREQSQKNRRIYSLREHLNNSVNFSGRGGPERPRRKQPVCFPPLAGSSVLVSSSP